jgi:NTE family protein
MLYQGKETIEPWVRARRNGTPSIITPSHILASTAIPLLFPPVKIGKDYYGDGSLRNYTPLSSAIRVGAEKLLVVGVRQLESYFQLQQEHTKPSLGRIFSVILNSVILDAIDFDCERALRINQSISHFKDSVDSELRPVQICMLRPSQNIGNIAAEEMGHLPVNIKHLIKGLGSRSEASGLISYLLFEPSFTKRLLELGYKDTLVQKTLIQEFLSS